MLQNLFIAPSRRSALVLLTAFVLQPAWVQAAPGKPSPQAACAALDVHVVTLLEDQALYGSASPQAVEAAVIGLMKARQECRTGSSIRAIDYYEAIPLDFVPSGPFHRVLR